MFWGPIQDPTITVTLGEVDGSPHVEIREGKTKITREYYVPYSQRYLAVTELLGGVIGTAWGFVRVRPHADPEDPWLRAVSVSIDPIGGNLSPAGSTYCTYEKLKFTVEYEKPEFEYDGDTAFLSEELDGTAEFLTVGTTGLSWDSTGQEPLDVDEVAGYLRKMMTYSLTFHEMPYIPIEMWAVWGKINEQAFHSAKYNETFQVEEMLFGMPRATEVDKDTSDRLYDISLTMTRMPGGWNNILRQQATGFVPSPVYKNGSLYRPYEVVSVMSVIPPFMIV